MENIAHKYMTVDEYLALDEAADEKYEYCKGEVYARTGALLSHHQISSNTLGELHLQLKGSGCRVYNSDLKIGVENEMFFSYPDLTVFCGAPQYYQNRRDILTNPHLIIEVLSKSTQNYDRGHKFFAYRKIPSLQEYVLISSLRFSFESFLIEPNGTFSIVEETDPDATVEFRSLGVSLPLRDLYEGVIFGESGGLRSV